MFHSYNVRQSELQCGTHVSWLGVGVIVYTTSDGIRQKPREFSKSVVSACETSKMSRVVKALNNYGSVIHYL